MRSLRPDVVSVLLGVILLAPSPADAQRKRDASGGGGSCPAEAQQLYVLDDANTLSRYAPQTRTFTDLGKLSCPAQAGATPFSLTADRSGAPWVSYSSGELFRVDPKSLQCARTAWAPASSFVPSHVAFSSQAAGNSTDALFLAGGLGAGAASSPFATLDVNTFATSTVGTVQGSPELSGTGSGELWAFFPDAAAPRIAQLDKSTGAPTKSYALSALAGQPTAWGFASWGADLWVFLRKDAEPSTTVYQIDGSTGAVKAKSSVAERTIVAAGVSTCAPVTRPR